MVTTEKKAIKKEGQKDPKNTDETKKTTKQKVDNKEVPYYKNQKFIVIIGILLMLMAIFLLMAFTSFVLHWNEDNSLIYRGKDSSWWRLITDSNLKSVNVMGKIGLFFSYVFITSWFGIASYLIALYMFLLGVRLTFSVQMPLAKISRYALFFLVWISIVCALTFDTNSYFGFGMGGYVGVYINHFLSGFIGVSGTIIILIFTLLAFSIIEFNFPTSQIGPLKAKWKAHQERRQSRLEAKSLADEQKKADLQRHREQEENAYELEKYAVDEEEENQKWIDLTHDEPRNDADAISTLDNSSQNAENAQEFELEIPDYQNKPMKHDEVEFTVIQHDNKTEETETEEESDDHSESEDEKQHFKIDEPYDPHLDLPNYVFPTSILLKDYENNVPEVSREELDANKKRIVETLNNYSVKIDKIRATIGPTVTLYEIVPSAGTRISRIKSLEDDIALSLAALGIRIIAPIPGKGTVGIEVPNSNPTIVSMRSVLEDDKFQNSKYALPIAIGKTISDETYVTDLAKMPHLLMAGATGQGKSVGLNAIIASLLFKKHPSELKFVMVDPKKVELALFSKIERHYLAKLPDSEEAIITDTKKVVRTLNSMVLEMDNRYELMKDAQVKNIKEYNEKFIARKLNPLHGHRFLPYIVLVVDEFGDLIMTAGKEIEFPIARLAQLARAIGIHLIIATQRPTVNVITGTIKANFPARIAFRVIQKNDSRTILDAGGADQLVGRGDMLLSTGSELIRLQCAFIDTPEIEELSSFIGAQHAYPSAWMLPEMPDEGLEGGSKEMNTEERDPLFEDAARIIVQAQQGSTSLLQRKLKLGYNRAGRLIDQLEAAGIVGPFEGSKAREVKIGSEMALDQFLKDLNGDDLM
ncbi:MAG: DNA translocase FtsK [Bacteroidales bacterium]|nr:DNA translocase FtsK [Bacteroidales bacterium]